MNLWRLSLAYLRYNLGRSAYNVLFFAVGTAIICLVLAFGGALTRGLAKNLNGIDMVVGAKGSPLQLVLSSVLHADVPTGNIPLMEVEALEKNPMVSQVIPLALGDNLQGFRIVGTTPDYPDVYQARLAKGKMFSAAMDAVLGSRVAEAARLKVGQRFAGSHGLSAGGELHDFAPYTVTGILQPTGTVLDRLVLTPVASVWHVHESDPDEPAPHPEVAHREITAALIKFRSPLAIVGLPRMINKETGLQAAVPAMEAFRLRQIVGVGSDVLTWLGGGLVVLAGLGLLVSMAEAVRQRLYDLTLMRCFGARPSKLMVLVLLEGSMISIMGAGLGVLLAQLGGHVLAGQVLSGQLVEGGALPWPQALAVMGGVVTLGVLGSLLPSLRVFRLNLPDVLAQR